MTPAQNNCASQASISIKPLYLTAFSVRSGLGWPLPCFFPVEGYRPLLVPRIICTTTPSASVQKLGTSAAHS